MTHKPIAALADDVRAALLAKATIIAASKGEIVIRCKPRADGNGHTISVGVTV